MKRTLAALVAALTAALCLMLLAFFAPSLNSGPTDVPVAVSGTDSLPGDLDVRTYGSLDEVREAVRHRDAVGGVALGPDGATVVTATGAGQPYPTLLKGVGSGLAAHGTHVTYDEVAPLAAGDPGGTALTVLALPLAFGGMASAAVLSFTMKRRYALRVIGSLAFSVLGGLALAAILQFGFDAVGGSYAELAAVLAVGIAATSMVVLGLEALLGVPGLALGAVLTLFVSNPLSGMATGWQWLPAPWGAVGQAMPIGAAGTAVRSVAYFDGNGMTQAVTVLVAWIVVGAAPVGLATLRHRGTRGR
ncbi:hypothetical protein CXF32_02105 [Corynebacterium bovis]|uniref:ABC transporter permease n=1 Tax=Corynebacterium bovis TaxID=36808 RepID=UPI000F63AFF4|nr:ABC transporter permease [Corynebacterium bovis]RRO98103.1 hypothetical protein CXF32_02105 [Corynebacterium bovis]RRQ00121.1 hypothetical protein CXF31_01330 [Corynebacterium bovis]